MTDIKNPFEEAYLIFNKMHTELEKMKNDMYYLKRDILLTHTNFNRQPPKDILDKIQFSRIGKELMLIFQDGKDSEITIPTQDFPQYCLDNNIIWGNMF